MDEANFPEHIKLDEFAINLHSPRDSEDGLYNINRGIALIREKHNLGKGVVNILLDAKGQKLGGNLRMWLIADFVQILGIDETEAVGGALDVIQSNAHITVGGKHSGINARIIVLYVLLIKDIPDPRGDLVTRQAPKPNNGTSTLNGLNNLRGQITGEGKPGGIGMQFHGPSQGLLGGGGHTIGLIQEYNLMSARGQGDLLLGEHLDAGAYSVDAAVVRGVELQDSVAELGAEGLAGQGHDGGCLAAARGPGEHEVGHVAVYGDDAETVEDVDVADDVGEELRTVLFDPGELVGGGGRGGLHVGGGGGGGGGGGLSLGARMGVALGDGGWKEGDRSELFWREVE